MAKKLRVLHLLQSNHFSGAENVVCQIIGMMKNNDDIEMVYCSSDGDIREALKERNITFYPMTSLCRSEVKRVIKEVDPDIIHAHDMRASFVAAFVCGKRKLVSHIHNNAFDSRGLSLKSIAYLFAAIKAAHIFWVSQSSFNGYAFHKWFHKKSTVLYNIIDIDALYQKMQTDHRTYDYDVIYIGRLTHPKNPKRLMHVFEKIVKKMPSVKIGVVGTGDLEEETKALCCELNLQNHVEFLGFQSNPLKMLYDAKVMMMTSRWEGTPICSLEAMALGVPIISTPTDGLCDLIDDGETGYLSDSDEILAQKAVEVISNPSLRQKLSKEMIHQSKIWNDTEQYKQKIFAAYRGTPCNERIQTENQEYH